MTRYPMPFSNPYTYPGHGGIDYAHPDGTPIRAVADGVISFSGWWNSKAGYTRTIDVGNGIKLVHCHLKNLSGPAVGKRVTAGEVFATVGWTGHVVPANAAGAHLHHEVYLNGALQSGANYWKFIDRNRVIGSGSGSGSGGGETPAPNPQPTPARRKQSMSTIYRKQEGRDFTYALAGDSPGTSANWLVTTDTDLARAWGVVHGSAVPLSVPTWASYESRYLEPLRTK